MLPEPNQDVRRVRLVLLLLTAVWCVYWFVHAWHYIEDDAWIHMEFARSVANGQGFAFNGRVVAGDTAPIWVLLLVAVHAFLVNWVIAVKALSAMGAVVGFAGVYAFSERLVRGLPDRFIRSVFPAAMVVLVAVSPYTCYWIFSGMEALAGAGVACWAVLLATRERPTRTSFLTGCLMAGIGPLVRPEMAFLAAILALPLLGQWRRLGQQRNAATLAIGGLLLCGPVAAWSLYSLHAFGHLLPNTNAAKRASPDDSVVKRLLVVYAVGFPLVLGAGAAAILFAAARFARLRNSVARAVRSLWMAEHEETGIPTAAWVFVLWAMVATVFYIVNHTYVQTRYVMIAAPGLVVVIVAAIALLSRRVARAVYVLTLIEALTISVFIARPFVWNKGVNCDVVAELAKYIRNHLPPGTPIGTYSIGEIAFLSQYPIIDTGGITRPEALQFANDTPIQQAHWAMTVGAQYYIGIKPQPHSVLMYRQPTREVGWTIHPSMYNKTELVELWTLRPDD